MRHLQKSGIITLKALGSPIGSRTAQVQEQQLEETKFIAFFMGKKIDIDGKDLYDAKQKAITQLKVPKSKVGLLAVVSAESQRNQDFKFESVVNEEALPKDGSTIKINNIPVKIEYVSNRKYIGYSWKGKNNKENYEETKVSNHSNLNSLIKAIKVNLAESVVNEGPFTNVLKMADKNFERHGAIKEKWLAIDKLKMANGIEKLDKKDQNTIENLFKAVKPTDMNTLIPVCKFILSTPAAFPNDILSACRNIVNY
jgi:hypothetical protein